MDLEHFEMIGGMVVLSVVIVAAINFQVSQMEGLSDVAGEWSTGEGTKAAASFHIANRDGHIGIITSSTKNAVTTSSTNGCNADILGVRSQDTFKFNWSESSECGSLSRQETIAKIPLRIKENGNYNVDYFNAGIEGGG